MSKLIDIILSDSPSRPLSVCHCNIITVMLTVIYVALATPFYIPSFSKLPMLPYIFTKLDAESLYKAV